MEQNYKVSVFFLTYNHVNYVRESLESILSQKSSFPYNILVFDDASTDGTSAIVRYYADKYPDIIHAHIPEVNTWNSPTRGQFLYELRRQYCTGTYICYCEGDDAWTDCQKLQLQADYLDANPGCSMVCHNYTIEDHRSGTSHPWSYYTGDCAVPPEDIILQPYGNLATASLMMRRDTFFVGNDFPRQNGWLYDYHYHLSAIERGYVWYLAENMSKYRYMHPGSWTDQHQAKDARTKFVKSRIDFLRDYDTYTNHSFSHAIEQKILELSKDADI